MGLWESQLEQALKMNALSLHFGVGVLAKDSGTGAIELAPERKQNSRASIVLMPSLSHRELQIKGLLCKLGKLDRMAN